jgi:hypothetical protein
VPNAFASRPNLITKAALVEQAFSLRKYDVDRLAKYDSAYAHEQPLFAPAVETSALVDNLTKDRILNHLATLRRPLAMPHEDTDAPVAKDTDDDTDLPLLKNCNKNCKDMASAALVAALRLVFEDKKSDITRPAAASVFEFRQLLQAVTSHAVLQGADGHGDVGASASSTATTYTTTKHCVESILVQLCRQTTADLETAKTPEFLQGLLLAILSLLAPQQDATAAAVTPSCSSSHNLGRKSGDATSTTRSSSSSTHPTRVRPDDDDDDDKPDEPTPPVLVQVASLLYLLPLPRALDMDNNDTKNNTSTTTTTKKKNSTGNNYWHLDPDFLVYFGQAAAVAVERAELNGCCCNSRHPRWWPMMMVVVRTRRRTR